MGSHEAVGLVNRREIASADEPATMRERLVDRHAARHLDAAAAARGRQVDEVILPGETRARLSLALSTAAPNRGVV